MARSVFTLGCRFGRWGWKRWQTCYSEQKFVRSIEEIQVGIEGAVGGGEKDSGVARVVDGYVGGKPRSPTCLFDDV